MPDAEDSSYDSDYEAEDLTTMTSMMTTTTIARGSESQVSPAAHAEISRTVSDTLAAEFAEYVTVEESSSAQNPGKFSFKFFLKLLNMHIRGLISNSLELDTYV